MRKLMGWFSGLGVLLGCGGDGGAVGPGGASDVSGTWNAIWQNMTGPGMSCSAEGGRLELSQGGSRFSGSYKVQTLTCNGMTGSPSTGSVLNGTAAQNQIEFDLNTPGFHQTGSLNGDEMSGQATWTLTINGTSHTVTGTWTASRTCGSSVRLMAFSCR